MKKIFIVNNFKINILLIFACLTLLLSANSFGDGLGNGSAGSPSIAAVVNTYASVININTTGCSSAITLLSSSGFSAGDLVLIIQMEGATINSTNTPSYGTILNYNNAGNFEYSKIFSVAGNLVQTMAPLINNYDITGVIQLIRVPQYTSPIISGAITCPAWNGITGGVIALDATGTITMNANIDANAKGFRGGAWQSGNNVQFAVGDYSGINNTDSFSLKGEGIAAYNIVPYVSGRGAAANGGGGGNNHNSGGGGGSSAGCGGNGGYAIPYLASYTLSQGMGGYAITNAGFPFKIFMGGGGGAGNANGISNSSGANGGGIVLITANVINANTRRINVSGNNANTTSFDGAGGGGAGGTIIIDCTNITSALNLDAHGGNGGNVVCDSLTPHGPGGGGGGGLISFTGGSLPVNITATTIIGGTGGVCTGSKTNGAANGCLGNISYSLALPKTLSNITYTSNTDTAFCNSGSLSLTASPGNSFSWSPASGLSCANCQAPIATVNATTVYIATVYSSACLYIDSFTVNINPLPGVTLNNFTPVCEDASSFPLTGGNPIGGSYFGNGVTGGNFNPSIAGVGNDTIFYNYTDANGCTDTISKNILVNALPIVTQNILSDVCVNAPIFVLTGGNPAGGSYFGAGVTANNFNPSVAGTGIKTITYTYTDANGCSSTDSTTLKVNALPVVTLTAFTPVCVNGSVFTLSGGNPAGGSYSGVGVTAGNFNPSVAGAGIHAITYSFTDANGCSNSKIKNITVNALPNVTLSSFTAVCVDAPSLALSGGNPVGGNYSGTGVSANNFDPTVAGVGLHSIIYSFTDANGCSNNAAKNMVVNALPLVSLGSINPVCIASAPFNLATGNPAGGIYSGVGVGAGIFNPASAGVGTHKIYYSYNDANSCSNIDSTIITVYNLPVVTFSIVSPVCDGTPAFVLSQGSPAGGIYSGFGVAGNNFNPGVAGIGTQIITYSYTDANGCGNTAQGNITVNALPNVILTAFNPVCVNAPSFPLSGGSPAGGNYTGSGVSANSFNPAFAGVGLHSINYTYTDGNGCSNNASKNMVVNAMPVVTIGAINPVCITSSAFNLTTGTPTGGTYAGVGVNAGIFNPANAGVGTHKIYYVYSDVNSCSNTDSTFITVYNLPVVTFSTVSPVCDGTPAFALTQGLPAGGIYSGVGVAGNNFNPAVAGVGTQLITYTYNDANGCGNTAQTTVTVNALPVVMLNSLPPVCVNTPSFPLSGGSPVGGNYSGAGVIANSFNPSLAGPGSHVITYVYVNANGCGNSAAKNMLVNPLIFLNAGTDDTICTGEYITLNASGANNIIWNPSSTLSCTGCNNPIADPLVNTTYFISSPSLCSVNDTITIYVVPAVTIDAGADTTICYDASAQLHAVSNYTSFSWNLSNELSCFNCADPIATPVLNSTYTVTVTNGICSASDQVTVNVNHVIVDAGTDVTIVNGESIRLHATGANTYVWSPANSLIEPMSSSPVAYPSITTLYKVLGFTDGCSDSDSVVVHVMDIGDAIFVPSAFTPDNDGKNDLFFAVHAGKYDSFIMKIFNRWGKLVFETADINIGWNGTSMGVNVPEGSYVYYIRMATQNNHVSKTGSLILIR